MNFQWILLAIFIVALIAEIAKAITRPMLKNILRLVAVPVAFIITFIIQALGLFQLVADKITSLIMGLVLSNAELLAKLPIPTSTIIGAKDLIAALISTIISPIFFVLVFVILLILIRAIHVNLVVKYFNGREMSEKKRELRAAIKQEKKLLEKAIRDEEERIQDALDDALEENNDNPALEKFVTDAYEAPDDDEIEDMVEARVSAERKRLKKSGYFKESSEKKAVSIACGAASGFLILAILFMPFFYGMGLLGTVTDVVESTDGDDTKIYQIVEAVDKHVVTPYENSFVYELYDSMALVDLMNVTVKIGGKINLANGDVTYFDTVLKKLLSNGVRAAIEVTSAKSEQDNLANDVGIVTSDEAVATLVVDLAKWGISQINTPEDSGDLMSGIVADIINHYKNIDDATLAGDIGAISDTLVIVIEKGILNDYISGKFKVEDLTSNPQTLGELIGSMSGLSVYGPMMEGAFTVGIEMLGQMLGIPADNATAYQILVDHICESVEGTDPSEFDIDAVERFIKVCAESENNKIGANSAGDPDGAAALLDYMTHWADVQNAFMHSSEDLSLGYFTMVVDGKLYVCDLGKVDLTNVSALSGIKNVTVVEVTEDVAESYNGKISPIADLIHYIAQNAQSGMNKDGLKALLGEYVSASADDNSKATAERILDEENFVSKGVTVEKMHASTEFGENWTAEEKKADSEKLVSVIFGLLDMMSSLGASTAAEGTAELDALLGQFVGLGKIMDIMCDTSCISELPPLMLEGLVKNEMFSAIITPVLVNQINEKVQNNDDLSYEQYMKSLSDLFSIALKGLSK